MGTENLGTNGIRSPDRPARSELLYRLSYRVCGNTGFSVLKFVAGTERKLGLRFDIKETPNNLRPVGKKVMR